MADETSTTIADCRYNVKILINPVWDMETIQIVSHDGAYECSGPFFHYKGDQTAKNAEIQQANFNAQLMQIFQAQYGKQSAITDYLTKQMEPLISKGGQGYSPEALSAMRTSATDTLSNQFQGAARAANATMQRGLPSGVNAQISGSLYGQEAQQQAEAQLGITQQNEALKQANYWNSINVLNGQTATLNPLGYANSATSGSSAVAGLSNAYQNSKSGFWSNFGSSLGSGIGKGVSGALFG